MSAQKSIQIPLHLYEKTSEIADRLDEQYGPRRLKTNRDPVGEVVQTILSQHTSDVNSGRAYASLRAAFPTWESVVDAPSELIAESIRSGGLADQKAPRIQHALATILEARGAFDLSFLSSLEREDARDWLMSIHGVGPKTASCVLLFSLGMPVMPVDTHIHRVSIRLGIMPPSMSAEAGHKWLESLLGDDPQRIFAFHVEMIQHGRQICVARAPRCDDCFLRDICDFAASAKIGRLLQK
jgi:endonuclease-3